MAMGRITVATLVLLAAAPAVAAQPNVLLICIDDLKPALGCYGDPLAKTPRIDALAARGVRFDAAYCNQAVCAPSRNALLTGLRPQTLGVYDLGTNFRRARPSAVTLPQYFKQHGYRTEGIGKIFHVGHGNHEDPRSWSVPHWRSKVVQYALPQNRPAKGMTREEALFDNVPAARANQLPKGMAWERADVPDSAYADGQAADEAISRLHRAAESPDQPWFLAVGFVKPHLPFCAPQRYWDLYKRSDFRPAANQSPPQGAPQWAPTTWGELRQYRGVPDDGPLSADLQQQLIHGYYAATSYVDAQVGRVLDALDQNDQAANTIVVLWGDHGWHLGDHGMWCKHTNYEQATRIPLIVAAPSAIAGSRGGAALVESVDVYPSLCALAGLPLPPGLDGASFAQLLADPAAPSKPAIFHAYPRQRRLGVAVRTPRYRLVQWQDLRPGDAAPTCELYDYQQDPGETQNLADDQPETVAMMRSMLASQPTPLPPWRAPRRAAK